MRLLNIVLLCLGTASCTVPAPPVTRVGPASPELIGRQTFELIAPLADETDRAQSDLHARLATLLREGLEQRGYRPSRPAHLLVHYWLDIRDHALQLQVDAPPPSPLGPYQAIHRLHDQRGSLHLRLSDPEQRTLWEGTVDTGLSPARDSSELLERAVHALVQQLPAAR